MRDKTKKIIGGRECLIYDCGSADDASALLIQPVDDHDIEVLDSEVSHIEQLTSGAGFTLAAFKVNDWNTDLSPWEAPPVFSDQAFGSGAEETLNYITGSLLHYITGSLLPALESDFAQERASYSVTGLNTNNTDKQPHHRCGFPAGQTMSQAEMSWHLTSISALATRKSGLATLS